MQQGQVDRNWDDLMETYCFNLQAAEVRFTDLWKPVSCVVEALLFKRFLDSCITFYKCNSNLSKVA